MRDRHGNEMVAASRPRVFINDPEAICGAALMGMGVAMLLYADMTLPRVPPGPSGLRRIARARRLRQAALDRLVAGIGRR